jgi:hypothetical protein
LFSRLSEFICSRGTIGDFLRRTVWRPICITWRWQGCYTSNVAGVKSEIKKDVPTNRL